MFSKYGSISEKCAFALILIILFSLISPTRLNEVFIPSQMKAGFFTGESKVDYNNFILKQIKTECFEIPCKNEQYVYSFKKTFLGGKPKNIVLQEGVAIQMDPKWIKSAGIGGQE